MKSIIGIIKQSNFIESDFSEILRPHFKEFTHKGEIYLRITTFEKYAMENPFEEIFYNEEEFNSWLIEVPNSITKLQAISLLLQQGHYDGLMVALNSDQTGAKKILFEAAHQLDRGSAMVNEIGLALGMSSDDIDDFFVIASRILI